jgi:hypothetical protein
MPVPKPNRWHPATHRRFQIEDCRLAEVEAQVESKTRYEPDPDAPPPGDDDAPPF